MLLNINSITLILSVLLVGAVNANPPQPKMKCFTHQDFCDQSCHPKCWNYPGHSTPFGQDNRDTLVLFGLNTYWVLLLLSIRISVADQHTQTNCHPIDCDWISARKERTLTSLEEVWAWHRRMVGNGCRRRWTERVDWSGLKQVENAGRVSNLTQFRWLLPMIFISFGVHAPGYLPLPGLHVSHLAVVIIGIPGLDRKHNRLENYQHTGVRVVWAETSKLDSIVCGPGFSCAKRISSVNQIVDVDSKSNYNSSLFLAIFNPFPFTLVDSQPYSYNHFSRYSSISKRNITPCDSTSPQFCSLWVPFSSPPMLKRPMLASAPNQNATLTARRLNLARARTNSSAASDPVQQTR